jgi:hypothetical protein
MVTLNVLLGIYAAWASVPFAKIYLIETASKG